MGSILFPQELNEVTDYNVIPRLLRDNEELQLYRKYYFTDLKQKLKCMSIEKYDGYIFYFLSNDNISNVMSYPITYECYTFTLDKYNIMSRDIINDNQSYRGYQIKWWLYKHPQYKYKFFREILPTVVDDYVYKLYGKYEHGKYVNCKIVLKYKGEHYE